MIFYWIGTLLWKLANGIYGSLVVIIKCFGEVVLALIEAFTEIFDN